MSKAFTSEETPDLGPVVRPPPRLAPGEVRYVTPEGQAALREALARLRADRGDAARLPDAERPARLGELDARIAALDATLGALTVLGPEATPEGQVGFGTWVTVEEEDGRRVTWRLVGPDEADARRGLISAGSPVARALLGRRAGDVVEVNRPGGEAELTVVAVRRTAPP
ncbi:GreA/GreB family elongation factor [Anaeromyxobacter sp. K]|uniref:GreA/GreB family elongation factor n=1 Tax=Anaeromyxobacter sp. (strain K) TaxID=447217 RepID=UPI00015F8653|nr:GreA/GreB family elongation factor [Anaeromyxobacter sp. K]ACG72985.1 GreA/GreB family elongation factor [Anaeromyxobacter sp. K]